MFFLQLLKPKTSKKPLALVTNRKTIPRPPCFADWRVDRTRSWRITMSSSQLWLSFCSHIVAWLHDTSKVYVLWIEAVLLSWFLTVYWVICETVAQFKPHEWMTVFAIHSARKNRKTFWLRKSRWRCTRKDGGCPNTWPPKPFLGTIWRFGAHADRWLYLSNFLLDLAAEPVEDDAFLWSRSGKGDVVFRGWNFWHTDRGRKRKSRKA